jgi:hypothetical protein
MSLAVAWLLSPDLEPYTLQVFAAAIAVYLITWRLSRKKPQFATDGKYVFSLLRTISFGTLGFSFLILIGYLGGFNSPAISLIFIYIFLVIFKFRTSSAIAISLITLTYLFLLTSLDSGMSTNAWGYLISAIVYMAVVIVAKRYFEQVVAKQQALKLEREKLAYYNVYAEQQKEMLLTAQNEIKEMKKRDDLTDFIKTLIPVVDELQKKSRFSQNQLVVSQELTKISLSLRQALKAKKNKSDATTKNQEKSEHEEN